MPVETALTDIRDVLKQRGGLYGPFTNQARIVQRLKATMVDTPGWEYLRPFQKEALEMVQHKIGRILNGDPGCLDSWVDQIGYLQLVVDELKREAEVG